MEAASLERLGECLDLGSALEAIRAACGTYELRAHWQQGEFHHDVVIEVPAASAFPGHVLVVATNCNGGVKEILALEYMPERGGLWHMRCPENPEFSGEVPHVLASIRTAHWFNPCELLAADARSELKPEFRERQQGGGWKCSGN